MKCSPCWFSWVPVSLKQAPTPPMVHPALGSGDNFRRVEICCPAAIPASAAYLSSTSLSGTLQCAYKSNISRGLLLSVMLLKIDAFYFVRNNKCCYPPFCIKCVSKNPGNSKCYCAFQYDLPFYILLCTRR